ncbi:hypothetical protein [Flavobacterium sp.]|uniref:hypothetical protein n=1 Tax=Flavobacterium sp. TaxID=239 RepID=UPI0040488C82
MTEINPLISELFIFNEEAEENVLSFSENFNFQVIVVDLSQILVGIFKYINMAFVQFKAYIKNEISRLIRRKITIASENKKCQRLVFSR